MAANSSNPSNLQPTKESSANNLRKKAAGGHTMTSKNKANIGFFGASVG